MVRMMMAVLGIGLRAFCMLRGCATTESYPQLRLLFRATYAVKQATLHTMGGPHPASHRPSQEEADLPGRGGILPVHLDSSSSQVSRLLAHSGHPRLWPSLG